MPATRPPNAEPTGDGTVVKHHNPNGEPFHIRYDKLVVAVGAYSQSTSLILGNGAKRLLTLCAAFNIPGVKEHAHFLKDVRDARRIRSRILECECLSDMTMLHRTNSVT